MRAIAVNGSPRRKNNTATLLEHALEGAQSQGAEIELVHLYDLHYRGCTSCFACKRKGGETERCAMKDDLSPVLDSILEADVLLLGSPIYFNDVTGETRSFFERLAFPLISYDNTEERVFKGSIASALFFTMNMPEEGEPYYRGMFEYHTQILNRVLGGESRYLASYDTLQFDDYAQYAAGRFDPELKKRRHEKIFPQDCKKAFAIGAALTAK